MDKTFSASALPLYFQYPVVFAPDLGVGIMDIIFGNADRMEIMKNMVEDAIINKVKIAYTLS